MVGISVRLYLVLLALILHSNLSLAVDDDEIRLFRLAEEDEEAQQQFYTGSDSTEFINLCKYNGVYDFQNPQCPANVVVPPAIPDPDEPDAVDKLKRRRQLELEMAVKAVRDFKTRLESHWEFIVQIIVMVLPLSVGLYLLAVGHFEVRTLVNFYYLDRTFGMPCWQYIRMKYATIKVSDKEKEEEDPFPVPIVAPTPIPTRVVAPRPVTPVVKSKLRGPRTNVKITLKDDVEDDDFDDGASIY